MSNKKQPKYKNRDQSILEFFESLQKEYLIAEIRSKIYPKAKDRRYYKDRVMEGKKRSITQISDRNNIPSIFTSTKMLERITAVVIPEWGLPNFTYKDNETKDWMANLDKCNYFAVEAEVAIRREDDSVEIGTITYNRDLLNKGVVTVRNRELGQTEQISIENLKRIL